MLAVKEEYRGRGVATQLVRMAIDAMIDKDADEVSSFIPFIPFIFTHVHADMRVDRIGNRSH